MDDELLKSELLNIYDYAYLSKYITKLEAENLKVKKQMNIINKIMIKLEKLDKNYFNKFTSIL